MKSLVSHEMKTSKMQKKKPENIFEFFYSNKTNIREAQAQSLNKSMQIQT